MSLFDRLDCPQNIPVHLPLTRRSGYRPSINPPPISVQVLKQTTLVNVRRRYIISNAHFLLQFIEKIINHPNLLSSHMQPVPPLDVEYDPECCGDLAVGLAPLELDMCGVVYCVHLEVEPDVVHGVFGPCVPVELHCAEDGWRAQFVGALGGCEAVFVGRHVYYVGRFVVGGGDWGV